MNLVLRIMLCDLSREQRVVCYWLKSFFFFCQISWTDHLSGRRKTDFVQCCVGMKGNEIHFVFSCFFFFFKWELRNTCL